MKKVLILTSLLLSATMLTSCVKVVKIGEEGKYTGNTTFNAADNVGSLWDSAVIDITDRAVYLPDLLTEANGDLKSAPLVEKYGKYSMGTSGTISYAVKGSGTVTEVENTKKAGYIIVKLNDYEGSEVIKLQTGPVYKGSSTRDNLSIIDFGNYTNQGEWAEISKELNTMIDTVVITPADVSTIEGKEIDFIGTFEVSGNDELLITPINLTVK